MKVKLLYIILFAAAGVAITCTTLTSVYGTGSLTNMLVSPSTSHTFSGVQYVFAFTTGGSTSTIQKIVLNMPSYTTVGSANFVVSSLGFNSGATFTVTNANSGLVNPSITVTLNSPQMLQNKNIVLFIARIVTPGAIGPQTVTMTTYDTGGNPVDTGSAAYYEISPVSPSITDTGTYSGGQPVTGNVGIGTTTPAQKLEVNGNVQADGNVGLSGNIVPSNNNDICIGSNC